MKLRHIVVATSLALLVGCSSSATEAGSTIEAVTADTTPVSHTTSVSTATAPASDEVTTAVAAKRKPKTAKKVSIRVLPAIAQPGAKPAASSKAKVAITTTVSPKRKTAVTLQVKAGKKWKKVASATTDKKGRHTFQAALKSKGKAATYRVVSGKKTSKSAATSKWLKATFTDEFSGGSLSNAWQHQRQHYNPAGLRFCSKGSNSAATVGGGTLALKVMKDPNRSDLCAARRKGQPDTMVSYRLNGNVSTQDRFAFKYGFASARIKFPRSQGQHGSVWMMPQDHIGGNVDPKLTGAEIDIVESFGKNSGPKNAMGLSQFTYHWALQNGEGIKVKTGGYMKDARPFLASKKDNWWDRYHVFSVEWTPEQYIFYIDGKESWRSNVGVSGQRQYLALSLLSSDYEIPLLEGGEKNVNQRMDVDWIKVWETN